MHVKHFYTHPTHSHFNSIWKRKWTAEVSPCSVGPLFHSRPTTSPRSRLRSKPTERPSVCARFLSHLMIQILSWATKQQGRFAVNQRLVFSSEFYFILFFGSFSQGKQSRVALHSIVGPAKLVSLKSSKLYRFVLRHQMRRFRDVTGTRALSSAVKFCGNFVHFQKTQVTASDFQQICHGDRFITLWR